MTTPKRRGTPFVVSAPSGTGKTTVCRAVVEEDSLIDFSISHTTRHPRTGERDGIDYHFVSEEKFRHLVDAEHFVEFAEYGKNLYGTSWDSIDEPLGRGRDVLLEIDVQGAAQIRERRDDARLVFLIPPSLESLESRLRGRATDAPDVIQRRLTLARGELQAVHRFHYVVVNQELEAAIAALLEIIQAERSGEIDAVTERYGREAVLQRGGGVLEELPRD